MGKASRKKEQQTQGISSAQIPISSYQSFLVRPLPAILIVLLLSFVVNFNVLSNGFGWDDEDIINSLRLPDQWWSLFLLNPMPDPAVMEVVPYYRPLVSISYLLDFMIWGRDPFGFHLSVLLAHLLNTALVFLLAQSLIRDKKPPYTFLPIIVASLFAVHPIHSEAVAWIAGRNDVLCTTFVLSSILLYIRFRRNGQEWAFGLSMILFFFALLTKEMAIGLVLLFPLYDYLTGPPSSSQTRKHISIRFLIPLMILGLYLYLRTTRLAAPLGPEGTTDFISLETIKKVIGAAGFYLKLMIFPYPLNPFITTLPTSASFLLFSALAWALLIGGLILSLIRREALLGLGLACGIVTLSPAIWIGIMGVPATLAAERYLYAPSVGFLIVLVWSIFKGLEQVQASTGWPRQRVWWAAGLIGIILLTVWGWESWSRNGIWKNKLIFWETAVNGLSGRSPQNALAHYNLGFVYKDFGSLDKAIEQYQTALELKPNYADAHNNLGNVYSKQGHLEEAIREYQTTLKLQPDLSKAHYNIGNAHIDQGHLEEAIQEYQIALKLQPDFAEAYYNLAKAYVDQERLEEAIQTYHKAINIKPDYVEAYNSLGMAYVHLGRFKEAVRQFQDTLRLQPNHANAHSNLGFVYAQDGQLDEAILEFETSLKLNPTNAEVHTNLGTALRQQGKTKEAREEFQKALQLKPDFLPARKALESLPK